MARVVASGWPVVYIFLGHFLERNDDKSKFTRDLSQVQRTFVGAATLSFCVMAPLEKCYTAVDLFDNNRDTDLIKNYSLW